MINLRETIEQGSAEKVYKSPFTPMLEAIIWTELSADLTRKTLVLIEKVCQPTSIVMFIDKQFILELWINKSDEDPLLNCLKYMFNCQQITTQEFVIGEFAGPQCFIKVHINP